MGREREREERGRGRGRCNKREAQRDLAGE